MPTLYGGFPLSGPAEKAQILIFYGQNRQVPRFRGHFSVNRAGWAYSNCADCFSAEWARIHQRMVFFRRRAERGDPFGSPAIRIKTENRRITIISYASVTMGLFDKIGGALDKTTTLIDKSAKTIAKDRAKKDHDKYLAGIILEKFDVKLLKNLCRYYKVGEPDPTKFKFSTGNVVKERVNRSHWVQHAIDNITLVDITDYAKKHGISLSDVMAEGERLVRERDEKYKV